MNSKFACLALRCGRTILNESSSMTQDHEKEIIPAAERSVSPSNPQYPLYLFAKSIAPSAERVQEAASAFYDAAIKNASIASQIVEATDKGVRYVVDTSDAMLDALEKGRIKFTQEKNGQTFAQLRDSNGHYGSKVPIKREEFARGIDPVQMANAIQLKAFQSQMEDIHGEIIVIDRSVKEVLQGQRNDRQALYLSGLSLYLEAREVQDGEMRKNLLAQAQRSLSDASTQIALELQADIDWIKGAKKNNFKGIKSRSEELRARIDAINEAFASVHQSALLRAAIYGEIGELNALTKVLEGYARFIDESIVGNAGLLAECDPNDHGFEQGLWRKRARLSLDVSEVAKRLNASETVFYLGEAKEGEDEEE